jgi:hypothetical protein
VSPRFYPPFQGYALKVGKSLGWAIQTTSPLLTSLLKTTETNRGTMNPSGWVSEGILDRSTVVNGIILWWGYDLFQDCPCAYRSLSCQLILQL